MAFEDKTLQCADCNEAFVFSASEQDFFAQKQLTSAPKRCKTCRQKAKKRKQTQSAYSGEYRSPAFNDPQFRQRRGQHRHAPKRAGSSDYRSPSFRNEQTNFSGEYRSPAFREYEAMDNADEYRSPAFKEYDHVKPEEEYRSPAFREYDHINPADEYRSPAFASRTKTKANERPLFSIICVACGQQAMVPFVPEEKEDPMCRECYREHKELLRKEQEEEDRLEAARAAAEKEAADASHSEPEVSATDAGEKDL